jgi:hypothetical protein
MFAEPFRNKIGYVCKEKIPGEKSIRSNQVLIILIASKDKLNTEAINSHCDKLNAEGLFPPTLFQYFLHAKRFWKKQYTPVDHAAIADNKTAAAGHVFDEFLFRRWSFETRSAKLLNGCIK